MSESPSVTLNGVNLSRLPITRDELEELVKLHAKEQSSKDLITEVLQGLSKKSSRFKYIVSTYVITAKADADNQVESSFGAIWNKETDGLLTVKLEQDKDTWLILSVVFVAPF